MTWLELDDQFKALRESTRHMTIQYRWGVAGTAYIVGGGDDDAMLRFTTLCAHAGEKLAELPRGSVHELAMMRNAPVERWCPESKPGYSNCGTPGPTKWYSVASPRSLAGRF